MKKEDSVVEDGNINSLHLEEKLDYYQVSLRYEEEESKNRSEDKDQEKFAAICKQIRQWMKEILNYKINKSEKGASEIEERKMQVLMQVLTLRKLSRIQKVRLKAAREKTIESRQGVDATTLKLQNLLYEVSHLKKEVRRCLEFQSADKEIDLIPIEQFYQEAPESICRPEETVENPHEQRLAQLHWELEQRRGQTQLFDQLTQEKEKVAAIISEQESKLSSLAPGINSILQATAPLQTALGLNLDEKKVQQKQSQYLPPALYTLWVQASAYSDACDSLLKAEIKGDIDAAKKLGNPLDEDNAEASDSEPEIDLQEDNQPRKSRSQKEKQKLEIGESDENLVKQLLSLHPLYITLTIKTNDKNSVSINFYYALNLKIVTTKCSVNLVEKSKPVLIDVVNGETFLNYLFPEDTGSFSPNPSNEYQLSKLKLKGLTTKHISMIGHPYKWAQTLSGLSFLNPELITTSSANGTFQNNCISDEADVSFEKDEDDLMDVSNITIETPLEYHLPKTSTECVSWRMSAEHMHNIILAIRKRLEARLALKTQLIILETANSTSCIPVSAEILQEHFPGKISSELRSWKPIAWTDYEGEHCTKPFIKSGFVSADHLFFKATFERQAVKMEAFVAVSPDYPYVSSIFAISLSWDGEQNISLESHIKQLESEVNVHWTELISCRKDRLQLLSLQLYRVAMCLDIFTEALSIESDKASFHKEKIFFRPTRGPDRALPFKYLPKLGVFAQR